MDELLKDWDTLSTEGKVNLLKVLVEALVRKLSTKP